jgi:Na+/proline symporter
MGVIVTIALTWLLPFDVAYFSFFGGIIAVIIAKIKENKNGIIIGAVTGLIVGLINFVIATGGQISAVAILGIFLIVEEIVAGSIGGAIASSVLMKMKK